VTQPTLDVLEALLNAGGSELHGWVIIKETGRAGPTVYRVLERLREAGLVECRWEDLVVEANRPRRRFYRLTPNGVERARALLWERRRWQATVTWRPGLGGAL